MLEDWGPLSSVPFVSPRFHNQTLSSFSSSSRLNFPSYNPYFLKQQKSFQESNISHQPKGVWKQSKVLETAKGELLAGRFSQERKRVQECVTKAFLYCSIPSLLNKSLVLDSVQCETCGTPTTSRFLLGTSDSISTELPEPDNDFLSLLTSETEVNL